MKRPISLRIDEKHGKRLDEIADELCVPKSNLIRNILISYLEFDEEERRKRDEI